MRAVDRNRLQVLRRVRDFLKNMAEDPKLSGVIAELDAVIERLTAEAERQERLERQSRAATVSINALGEELRDDLLHPLAKLVRKVAKGTQVDGKPIEAALALPKQRDHEGLIAAANAIHALAMPHQDKLVASGLPKDLLSELLRVTAALKAARDARAQDYLNRSHAAAQGQAEGRNAGELLRFVNALMRKQVRSNPALRKAWEQAKRLGWGRAGGVVGEEVVPVVPVVPVVAGEGEVGKAA